MAWTRADYQRLGDLVVAAREAQGMDRAALAEAADITTRTLGDIESGELRGRRTFSSDTLAAITRVVGWPAGAWRQILNDPSHVPGQQVQLPGLVVGGDAQDEGSTLLFRRPDGLTDEQWQSLQTSQREHWEWLIDRASRER